MIPSELLQLAVFVLSLYSYCNGNVWATFGHIPAHGCDENCEDSSEMCRSDNVKHFCGHVSFFSRVVRSQCPKSCGICRPCQTQPLPCSAAPRCEDVSIMCDFYASLNYCEFDSLKLFMEANCRKTCRKCSQCQVERPRTCSDDCKDDDEECSYWANDLGYCDVNSEFYDWMTSKCRRSCGFCIKCEVSETTSSPEVEHDEITPRPFVFPAATCTRDKETSNSVYDQCLESHNYYRCLHGAKPLQYDPYLQHTAQAYADKMARDGKPGPQSLKHSTLGIDRANNVGENLAWRLEPNNEYDVNRAVADWYAEALIYDFDNSRYSDETGHFTQLIWKDTSRVGCALARHGNEVYVVAHYSTKGNELVGFVSNVMNTIPDVCKANCLGGTCHGNDGDDSTCTCVPTGYQNDAPLCEGNCVAFCPKPAGHRGYWEERCEGASMCTCSDHRHPTTGAWPGAQCF